MQQYSNPDFGFSLSYPAGYELQSSFPHSVVFLAPQGTSGHRERGWLTVELASEENAEWYANRAKEENANLGIEITSSTQVLDGQQAYILGQLPGQDLNRQVFIVDNGILYHLTFVPDDPASGRGVPANGSSLRGDHQQPAIPAGTPGCSAGHGDRQHDPSFGTGTQRPQR